MRRPEDIQARIGNIEQIEGVVVALGALASIHAKEARKHLPAISEQAETVAGSMAAALAFLPGGGQTAEPTEGRHLRIVVGAAQGFSGSYNERVVEGATVTAEDTNTTDYILIGQRCISEFDNRGVTPVWSANMVAHSVQVPALASQVIDAAFDLLGQGRAARVSIVYATPDGDSQTLTIRHLVPFDFARIAGGANHAPLLTLPPEALIAHLVEEYVFTEVCEALMLGFAAENEARRAAMSRARSNVQHIRDDLRSEFRQARQEQTTTEITELSEDAT